MLPYRFPLTGDSSVWRLSHLKNEGYVVLSDVLSTEQVETSKSLLLRDIEATVHVSTIPRHGIVASLAQTAGPWSVRGNPNVQKAFSLIWQTDDLITSMDAILLWPANRKPVTEGLHLDQKSKGTASCSCPSRTRNDLYFVCEKRC